MFLKKIGLENADRIFERNVHGTLLKNRKIKNKDILLVVAFNRHVFLISNLQALEYTGMSAHAHTYI